MAGVVRPLPRCRRRSPSGAAWAALCARLDRRHVAIAVDNLRHAFPDWDEARLDATARGVYRHFGAMLLDLLWLQGRSRDEITRLVEFAGRASTSRRRWPAGKGVICCTGHIGNWEVHAVGHGFAFATVGVVARPLDNPALDARLVRASARRRQRGRSTSARRLPQVIRAVCARAGASPILLDQNVQEDDGIFVDFFGRPAATTTVAAALALKTGCALVPGHTRAAAGRPLPS